MRKRTDTVSYAHASSGLSARVETIKILQRFGCESVGFLDHYDRGEVELYFKRRGRSVRLLASAKGGAALCLKAHPWSARSRQTRANYERHALEQGQIAINSILRDWVKE